MPEYAFHGNELGRLARLKYSPGIPTAPGTTGAHRARRSGQGTDFLDYRMYVPGDDVRRIDWVVYARLRQPIIRVLEHAEKLFVHFLIDLSQSMATGSPTSKAGLACQIATGLAHTALAGGDYVAVATFSDELFPGIYNLHGSSAIRQLIDYLRRAEVGGRSDISEATRSFCQNARNRGLVVLLSDLLGAGCAEEAVRLLLGNRFRVLLVQILDPIDWGEGLTGSLRLRDSESGNTVDIVASPQRVTEYQQRLRDYTEHLEAVCSRRGQDYLQANTRDNYLELIVSGLRRKGLLR